MLSATQLAPPLSSVVPDVPPVVAEIVDRALAFDKAARWPSAQAMRDALLEADKVIRSGEPPEEPEDEEDEKTRLAPAPEMTLRGEIAPPASPGPQFTVEISTLRESSTVAGVESQSEANRSHGADSRSSASSSAASGSASWSPSLPPCPRDRTGRRRARRWRRLQRSAPRAQAFWPRLHLRRRRLPPLSSPRPWM